MAGKQCTSLLVTFSKLELKDHIMANLKNLKQPIDKFRGIGISHDLPPSEREEIKNMIKAAKDEHTATASSGDDLENYKFLVVGKGQKRRVLKIKRKTVSVGNPTLE